jgi:hypothetical protein
MPHRKPRQRADDLARPTVASLGLQVKLVAREKDEQIRALIERYERLLYDWEQLSCQALEVLSDRPNLRTKRVDAVRRA